VALGGAMAKGTAIAVALAALTMANAADAADKLVLQLPGPAQFEFAGYYAALWQGYYRAAGFDVEIEPGGAAGDAAPLDPMREVAEGRAQFGVDPAVNLVIRAAQGQPLLLLAPIFQRSGAEIFYRGSDDYASPGALTGVKLGRLPASNALDIEMATALKAEGVDPDKLTSIPLQPGDGVAALAAKAVDAVPGSAWDFPWLAHERGLALKSINPADYRVEYYGDTLFTTQHVGETQPAMLRGFRAASLKGWQYALQHADEVAARLLQGLPHPPGIADAAGFTHYQATLAQALSRYPAVALGHSNPDRWQAFETNLSASGALLPTAEPADFVYDPDAAARRSNDLQSFAKLAAALLIAIAVAAWLGWRWRHRPLAVRAPAEAAAAVPQTAPAPVERAQPGVDLNATLANVERPLRQLLPRSASCRLSLLPLLWRCRAEPPEVLRLVLELVAAAAPDLGDGGEVVVGTRNYAFDDASLAATPGAQLGEYVRVTVRDNGKGLSEDALDRVFNPATTVRPAVAAAAATLRGQGGFARVESAEGIGTAVHLYFPRAVERDTGQSARAAE
jgi:ABC-type nitrate/sulfonate/bicarbonate transport system substrate-binding protein